MSVYILTSVNLHDLILGSFRATFSLIFNSVVLPSYSGILELLINIGVGIRHKILIQSCGT